MKCVGKVFKIKKYLGTEKVSFKVENYLIRFKGILGSSVLSLNKSGKFFNNVHNIEDYRFFFRCTQNVYKTLVSLFMQKLLGVSMGFLLCMELKGRGFHVFVKNNKLFFNLGRSHAIFFDIPSSVYVRCVQKKYIYFYSNDLCLLGNLCFKVRHLRKVNPYKIKGILYMNERIISKVGKVYQK